MGKILSVVMGLPSLKLALTVFGFGVSFHFEIILTFSVITQVNAYTTVNCICIDTMAILGKMA